MRCTIFRGKPTERFADFQTLRPRLFINGFVYGSLVVCGERHYICTYAECSNRTTVNNAHATMVEVISETVQQETGMEDKRGDTIFEGDTIKFLGGYCLGDWTGVVSYDDSKACFVASGERVRFSSDDPGTFTMPLCEIYKPTIEIIHSEGRIG